MVARDRGRVREGRLFRTFMGVFTSALTVAGKMCYNGGRKRIRMRRTTCMSSNEAASMGPALYGLSEED
ncbi:MAG: hypothetical protein ACYCYF_10265 [Anaerolineae bacterium]